MIKGDLRKIRSTMKEQAKKEASQLHFYEPKPI